MGGKIPLCLLIVLAMAGCGNIGPSSMSRDRFDYMETVAESWKSQMLQNLVRLRYGDTPVFLEVGQIVANYSFQRSLSANAGLSNSIYVPGLVNGQVGMGAQGVLTDTPTITYAPLAGERFARSMMMPLPVSAILNVLQSGYPADFVFRLGVQSVNGIDNRRAHLQHVRPANPEFYFLIRELTRIQLAGEAGIRRQKLDGEESLSLIFRPHIDAAIAESIRTVKKLLDLDPTAHEFRVNYGVLPVNNKEIAILTRSILEMLKDLASRIEVPEAHVRDHRVGPTPEPDQGPDGEILDLIRIKHSVDRPDGAFVTTPYQKYWFSIDNQDLRSKRLFTFLMFIFTFVEKHGDEAAPILTIPASR